MKNCGGASFSARADLSVSCSNPHIEFRELHGRLAKSHIEYSSLSSLDS